MYIITEHTYNYKYQNNTMVPWLMTALANDTGFTL